VSAGVGQRWPGVAGTSHGNVDVLENFAGRDATRAVGGADKIVAFLAAVFAADGVDEGQRRVKLLGGDQEARAIGCPFTGHSFHKAHPSGEEGGCEFRLPFTEISDFRFSNWTSDLVTKPAPACTFLRIDEHVRETNLTEPACLPE